MAPERPSMTEDAPTPVEDEPPLPEGTARPVVLRGVPVTPGLAIGSAYRKDYDLARVAVRRVPRDRVEGELNRFHAALGDSCRQLEDLRRRLQGKVPEDHARILDTHVAYLKDSVFLSDVENLILNEQMSLEASIAKVILDFDRIFRLVQSESLRERAVDLRDVGIRVLRNLERAAGAGRPTQAPARDYVLVARELSIVDMFDLAGENVLGILTEGGTLTSHAAILARSMHIPTLTGIEGLLEEVREGDLVIVDATEGCVRVRPDELVRQQYRVAWEEARSERESDAPPAWAREPAQTADGEPLEVSAISGTLPEIDRARHLGLAEVGLYRTELLYLIEREPPSVEALAAHYRAVLEGASGRVTFRLLDVNSSLELGYLYEGRETNPGLGRMGVRILLGHPSVLARQISGLLRAAATSAVPPRIAVPKVIDASELERVREILAQERHVLKRAGVERCDERIEIGAVIETPASALGVRHLARSADFLVINLNSLQQYLLAADRDNAALVHLFERTHPVVVRALQRVVAVCDEEDTPLSLFGVSAIASEKLSYLVGVGIRRFAVAPAALQAFLAAARAVDLGEAQQAAERIAGAASPAALRPLEPYGHGFAGP